MTSLSSCDVDGVLDADDLCSVLDDLGLDGEVAAEDGDEDAGDVRDGDGGEAVGVAVAVEAGLERQLASGLGVLVTPLLGQQVQNLLAVERTGAKLDGKSGNSDTWQWYAALVHGDLDGVSDLQSLDEIDVKVNVDLLSFFGHQRVGADADVDGIDPGVVAEAGASLEIGVSLGQGHKAGENDEGDKGLHLFLTKQLTRSSS